MGGAYRHSKLLLFKQNQTHLFVLARVQYRAALLQIKAGTLL